MCDPSLDPIELSDLESSHSDENKFKLTSVCQCRPDTEESFNQDLEALNIVHGNEDVVRAITVGSECLYRGTLPADQLLTRIQKVQNTFKGVQVGTVDSWNKFNDGTADPVIQGGVTYLLANGFAYWQSQNIDNATNTYFDDMSQAMHHIQDVAGENKDKIRFGNGETGWPTGKKTTFLSPPSFCYYGNNTNMWTR